MGYSLIMQDSFVSTGVGVNIPLPAGADYFKTTNMTQAAVSSNPGVCVMGEWYRNGTNANDTANLGLRWTKTNSSNALNLDSFATTTASGGFTYYSSVPVVEAAVTGGTAITAADPAVATITNSYSDGDRVRLYNTTGMLQIAGMDFTISSVSSSGFTLLGLPASGFAAAATALTARRISKYDAVEPRFLYITNISQASQAVVTVSCDHNYVVGELVYFSVPKDFGMSEISGLTGKITAINVPAASPYVGYGFTVDIDSSNFTAFSFPASGDVPTARGFATCGPAGQRTQYNPVTNVTTGYNFTDVPFRTGQFSPYINLAAGANSPAGVDNDVIVWQAYKAANSFSR